MYLVTDTNTAAINEAITLILRYQWSQDQSIYRNERRAKILKEPALARRIGPRNIPRFSNYTCPGAPTKTWRLNSTHFPKVIGAEDAAQRKKRISAEDNEISVNREILEYWLENGFEDVLTDAVAIATFSRECERMLKAATRKRSKAEESTLHCVPGMAKPTRAEECRNAQIHEHDEPNNDDIHDDDHDYHTETEEFYDNNSSEHESDNEHKPPPAQRARLG